MIPGAFSVSSQLALDSIDQFVSSSMCLLQLSLFHLGLAGLEELQKTQNNQFLPT